MTTKIRKLDSLSTLIKKMDDIFSDYIRLRDADNHGTVTCFITGERVWWRDADAAHFVGRSNMPTRYDEMNVHATTRDSNRFDPDHHTKYYLKMEEKYGWQVRQAIEQKGKSLMKFNRSDILEMMEEYSEKVAILKKQKTT